ncbi:beta-galactosidase [Aestuariimicrobium ganziense]|uniref:beta-galactosidase n=1 Tax=Aestuariimicrobium ganziense TaxID=2773677 RepID=UPI001941237D|nr:beta-galactosidase [Aestuariimicrobium ganziense]
MSGLLGERLRYGGDYNPEQWSPEVWRDDVALMKAAGVNLVSVGIFSWSTLQPGPDQWHFEWLDEVIELLHGNGIDVDLATPTASPPPWFGLAHEDALYVDARGVRTHHGARNHYCPSSKAYRDACRELARRLGERYGNHPGVVMWHIGNEYGPTCFCDLCAESFRAWLADRHGDIEGLNRAWGTAFWSQGYQDFSEVLPPRTAPYHHNPSHALDFRRYSSDALLRLFTEQRDVLRPLVGDAPITTNFMGFYPGVDSQRWAGEVDIMTDDHYKDPGDLEGGPVRAALVHDLMRSLRNEPWMMMEQAMGAVNWRPHNVAKTDVQRRHDVLRAVAHGADGVLSFQWRQSHHGAERFHSAMLPHAGADARLHRGVVEIGDDLARLSSLVGVHEAARVALLFDWDSWWALTDPTMPSKTRDPIEVLQSWYQPLWRRGVPVDLRAASDDLSGYDLVLAPIAHVVADDAISNLRGVVERGAGLVLGPFTVVTDETGGVHQGPFPVGLSDLLGAVVEQPWPLAGSGLALRSDLLGDGRAQVWADQVRVDDAEVLVSVDPDDPLYPDLDAVVVSSPRHRMVLVGADLPAPMLDRLVEHALQQAGVESSIPVLAGSSEDWQGCEVARRGAATFVFNPSRKAVKLGLRCPARDLLGGDEDDAIELPGGGVVVLVER